MFVRKLRTVARLTPSEKRQALVTILLMASVRLALWTVPFRVLKRISDPDGLSSRLRLPVFSQDQVAWAIRLASRYVPGASCLTQALTARILLNASGHPNNLHIGVARETGFEAHAWIELEGRILIGGAEKSARFAKILTLEGKTGA
jgi:hypothetical protein